MEGAEDDINADDLADFIDNQIKKESNMDLSKFVSEEAKEQEDECEAINTEVKKKVRRPPMKKMGSRQLSDLDVVGKK